MTQKNSTPSAHALHFGEAFTDSRENTQRLERGTILSVNPSQGSCDVETTDGLYNGLAFPYIIQDSEGGGGQIYVPRPGQIVVVQRGLGYPFITQILPQSVDPNIYRVNTSTPDSASGGNAPFVSGSATDFTGYLPKDLLQGDWMVRGNQGQYVGVLDGGVVALHADPWSQVVCSQHDDTTNVVGRNINVVSSFGNMRFTDDAGKLGFALEGGTDQTTESGQGRENWTVQARVGGEAEGFADFRINDRTGDPAYKTVWQADGAVNTVSTGSVRAEYAGAAHFSCAELTRQVDGAETIDIGGDRNEHFYGSHTTSVSQNRTSRVLSDRTDNINRDWVTSVGRTHTFKVSGDPLAKPKDNAADWMISNGSWVVDVGFPGTDFGIAQSGIAFNTYMPKGQILLSSLLDKIVLDTVIPDSVLLGSSLGVAPFHATLWEPLQIFLNEFIKWAQNHVHPTGVGPSGTAVVPYPASSVLSGLLPAIRSIKVAIGG